MIKNGLEKKITSALTGLARFVSDRDIVVSLLEGRFELKRNS